MVSFLIGSPAEGERGRAYGNAMKPPFYSFRSKGFPLHMPAQRHKPFRRDVDVGIRLSDTVRSGCRRQEDVGSVYLDRIENLHDTGVAQGSKLLQSVSGEW